MSPVHIVRKRNTQTPHTNRTEPNTTELVRREYSSSLCSAKRAGVCSKSGPCAWVCVCGVRALCRTCPPHMCCDCILIAVFGNALSRSLGGTQRWCAALTGVHLRSSHELRLLPSHIIQQWEWRGVWRGFGLHCRRAKDIEEVKSDRQTAMVSWC